jgi:hypothetical protein
MNTANAIPLNNPQYDLTTANHTVPLKDNKIVLMNSRVQQTSESSRMYIYDLTGTNPPEYFTGTLFHNISNDTSDLLNIRFDEQIPIITLNKTLYSFWINGKDIGVNKDGVELAPLIGADISGENAVLNTGITSYEHTFYDYAGMYIYKSGILSIENTPDGDITYSWTPRDLSFIFDGKDFYDFYVQFSVRNEKVYYFSSLEKTIKVAAPKIDDAYSICFNGADYGASTIWMVGDTIYFTKYESATSVSTYRLNSNETNPTKVSSSDVAMQSITELTF